MHRLEITRAAGKQLDRLPGAAASRVQAAIQGLAKNPRPSGSVKMSDMPKAWRIRVGEYRVIYDIHDEVLRVIIIRIGHRRDVYR